MLSRTFIKQEWRRSGVIWTRDTIRGAKEPMQVRIYKPSRSTMQADLGATRYWILEYPPEAPRIPDPLMGWTSARDTRRQVRLRFESLRQALDFAREHELEVDLEDAHAARRSEATYADNFAYHAPPASAFPRMFDRQSTAESGGCRIGL